jgi:hypothetical protein
MGVGVWRVVWWLGWLTHQYSKVTASE